ncbi:MAG TPA: hypothetical protein VK780_00580 [Thermoanaerobaculia bacterium]|jgi:hypothetical protein|nr:hypothetical protein [Thermoanaerobaculia bacterium]
MLSVDAAFERIGTALRQRGYAVTKEERPPDSSGDRLAVYTSPSMSVSVRWIEKARLLILQVKVEEDWVEFARRGFGPKGLEDTAVDALVRAVHAEVAETSTDPG